MVAESRQTPWGRQPNQEDPPSHPARQPSLRSPPASLPPRRWRGSSPGSLRAPRRFQQKLHSPGSPAPTATLHRPAQIPGLDRQRGEQTQQVPNCSPQRGLLAGLALGWHPGPRIWGGRPPLPEQSASLCLNARKKPRGFSHGVHKPRGRHWPPGGLEFGYVLRRGCRRDQPPLKTPGGESLKSFPSRQQFTRAATACGCRKPPYHATLMGEDSWKPALPSARPGPYAFSLLFCLFAGVGRGASCPFPVVNHSRGYDPVLSPISPPGDPNTEVRRQHPAKWYENRRGKDACGPHVTSAPVPEQGALTGLLQTGAIRGQRKGERPGEGDHYQRWQPL